jgi:hypothetical protein
MRIKQGSNLLINHPIRMRLCLKMKVLSPKKIFLQVWISGLLKKGNDNNLELSNKG